MLYEIREGLEEDRSSVVSMLTRAMSELERFHESWIDSWKQYWNRPENEEWAYVASYNEQIVANLSFFKNNFNEIRGNSINFGGVWAVATELEHRRKGLLKRLFEKAFARMQKEGIVLSILDPSPYYGAQIAYESCGYALAESRVQHTFPPDALKSTKGDPSITVRELKEYENLKKISDLELNMCSYGSRVFSYLDTRWINLLQEIKEG